MTVSHCCGAATKVVIRSDLPHVYDDAYDLQVPVLVCTQCGNVLDLYAIEADKNAEP
jgi:hypothetical protein